MNTTAASRISGGNSEYGRIESDFYPTPPEATQALINFLRLPQETTIWEPACGEGHMVRVFEQNGFRCIGTDIKSGDDFLETHPRECQWIITNPPFSLAESFIKRCIEHQKPFALLLKSQYWHAKRRLNLFREHKPDYILPLTWRPDFLFGERGSGSPLMDVVWVVWGAKPAHITKFWPLEKPEPDMRKGKGLLKASKQEGGDR